MIQNWTYLIFFTLFVNFHAGSCVDCPDGCKCSTSNLTCFSNNMKSIPIYSSMQAVTVLNMSSNQIKTLGDKVFIQAGLINVEIIDISYNTISEIYPNAFYGLNNLRELYLQGNDLDKLHSEIFYPLKQLVVLDLRNNSIKGFSKETFKYLPVLKKLSLSVLQQIKEDVFEPLRNLTQLQIQFVKRERNSNEHKFCKEQSLVVENWCKENNVNIDVSCELIPEDNSQSTRTSKKFRSIFATNFTLKFLEEKTASQGEYVIGIVITVGVILLLTISLIILAVIVRQTERMSEELDDYSYMSDFEPYRGHISPIKSREFYLPTSRDNIPAFMEENSATPNDDLVSNRTSQSVKDPVPPENNSNNSH